MLFHGQTESALLVRAFHAENMADLELIHTKEISADFGPLITYQ